MKIYLDTSVISYLLQTDAPEKMEETGRLWEKLKEGRDFITIEKIKISRKQKEMFNYFSFFVIIF